MPPPLPTDDASAELYEAAVDRLSELGIDRYEISNFAKPGHESLHNLKYWTMRPISASARTRIASMAGSEQAISNLPQEYVNAMLRRSDRHRIDG